MNCKGVFCLAVVLLVAMALLSGGASASSYRKPPFNGSIFGKRGSGASADAESHAVAFTALCEVALEACSSWMPTAQDSK